MQDHTRLALIENLSYDRLFLNLGDIAGCELFGRATFCNEKWRTPNFGEGSNRCNILLRSDIFSVFWELIS